MSFVLLGILNAQAAGGGGVTYYISTLGQQYHDFSYGIACDSENNVLLGGYSALTTDNGDDSLTLAKFDTVGAIQWQRHLGGSDDDEQRAVTVDSNDNIYIVGETQSEGQGGDDFITAKYDTDGNIQWQRILGGTAGDDANGVATDSSGNIYVVGDGTDSGGAGLDIFLVKYNSSGTLQWQRRIGSLFQSAQHRGFDVSVDSQDEIIVVGFQQFGTFGNNDIIFAKYDSNGTIQWQKKFGGSGTEFGYGNAVDSNDNIYIVGRTDSEGEGSADLLLAKFNSSGTIQWQRILGGTGFEYGWNVAIDSADNIYVNGRTNSDGSGGDDFLIAKYDSDGTIQWQRTLGTSRGSRGYGIAIDSNDTVYVSGQTTEASGYLDMLFAALPNDGSLQGTYALDGENFVYEASTLTASTSSLSSANSNEQTGTSALTGATSSLTSSSSSLTQNIVTI